MKLDSVPVSSYLKGRCSRLSACKVVMCLCLFLLRYVKTSWWASVNVMCNDPRLQDLTRVKAASEPSLCGTSFKNQAGRADPWEISAGKLSPSCHLLNETVPAATKHSLLRMGMSELAILSVKAHPDKLMLYEPGGCTLPSKAPGKNEKPSVSCSTMTDNLPQVCLQHCSCTSLSALATSEAGWW